MSFLGAEKTFGLYGPVFMVQKDQFERSRGFEAVKDNVAKNLNLGNLYNKHGMDFFTDGRP